MAKLVTVPLASEAVEGKVQHAEQLEKLPAHAGTDGMNSWVAVRSLPQPIWTYKPQDVEGEEYATIFRMVAEGADTFHAMKHFTVEGPHEFQAILFLLPSSEKIQMLLVRFASSMFRDSMPKNKNQKDTPFMKQDLREGNHKDKTNIVSPEGKSLIVISRTAVPENCPCCAPRRHTCDQ